MRAGLLLAVIVCGVGCVEYHVRDEPKADPADPPGSDDDLFGNPPSDWNQCYSGMLGLYYNLPSDHPDVEPPRTSAEDPLPSVDPAEVDWWSRDYQVFTRFDASTDFGANWWPVDEGMTEDPAYFTARWLGWIRVYDADEFDVVLGANTDAWVYTDDNLRVEVTQQEEFEAEIYPMSIGSGVHRIEVRYAHRAGPNNGLRFRLFSEDLKICHPEYSDDAEEE